MRSDPRAVERFIELGRQFTKLFDELRRCRERETRPRLLHELRRILTEADELVQRFNEDFRNWESE